METLKVSKWDAAEDMDTKEDVLAYLEVALEENDLEFLFKAIGDAARSKGMAQIAKELNLNRMGLYQALSEKGNPSFATMIKVLDNLGYRLQLIRKTA
ncbi:putative addiction module antidote protein [Spirochaetia bacterium]|nr:putative addiction module antidote protein [Spirochaetia bacterium]